MEGLDVRPNRDPGLYISYKISRLLRNFCPDTASFVSWSGARHFNWHRRTIARATNLCHVRVSEWSIQNTERFPGRSKLDSHLVVVMG